MDLLSSNTPPTLHRVEEDMVAFSAVAEAADAAMVAVAMEEVATTTMVAATTVVAMAVEVAATEAIILGEATVKEEVVVATVAEVANPPARSAAPMDMTLFAATIGSITPSNLRHQIALPTTPTRTRLLNRPGSWTPGRQIT
jgi:hypothetical protein